MCDTSDIWEYFERDFITFSLMGVGKGKAGQFELILCIIILVNPISCEANQDYKYPYLV